MQQHGVVRLGFEGVAESVAVVENAAEAALFFVGRYHPGLDADAFVDDRFEYFRVLRQHCIGAFGHDREQFGARDDAVLDHLVEAGAELAFR